LPPLLTTDARDGKGIAFMFDAFPCPVGEQLMMATRVLPFQLPDQTGIAGDVLERRDSKVMRQNRNDVLTRNHEMANIILIHRPKLGKCTNGAMTEPVAIDEDFIARV